MISTLPIWLLLTSSVFKLTKISEPLMFADVSLLLDNVRHSSFFTPLRFEISVI